MNPYPMKKICLISIILILFSYKAAKTQSTDDVLNLLINKKIIHQEDADSIRAEFAIKQQDMKEKQKLFGINGRRPIQISAYTQVRYQNFQEAGKPDGMDIRRARLDFRGNVAPMWEYRLQADFANVPKIVDVYAGFMPYDFLKFQVGQYKLPFSLENITSSSLLLSIERSQVVEALVARNKDVIGNQNGRDIGLEVYGSLFKFKERFLIDYFAGVFNGVGMNTTENNKPKDFCGRLLFHPAEGLDVGGATYIGYDRIGTDAPKDQIRNRFGGELSYTWKNLSIRGEYIEGQDAAVKKSGYYAQATYFIFAKKLQVLAKYDSFDPDKDKNISVYYIGGINYYFNDSSKISVNYTYKEEEGTKINNNVISTQVQISF
jgi:phosphate-selective porin OprO/OprP